ncbi:hypothetical protein ACVWXO_002134 [Bradyrhizobium sp. LM2.7]
MVILVRGEPYYSRRLRNLHASGRIQHGFDDVVVTGAAADIAFELVADGRLVELATMAVHDVDRRHDHAWRAIAALQAVIVAEGGLHGVQLVAPGDAFDGGDVGAVGLSRQHRAGFHRLAVHVHDAGTALAGVAADMGPGEVEVIAQELDQQGAVLDVNGNSLAVHCQFDCRHGEVLPGL